MKYKFVWEGWLFLSTSPKVTSEFVPFVGMSIQRVTLVNSSWLQTVKICYVNVLRWHRPGDQTCWKFVSITGWINQLLCIRNRSKKYLIGDFGKNMKHNVKSNNWRILSVKLTVLMEGKVFLVVKAPQLHLTNVLLIQNGPQATTYRQPIVLSCNALTIALTFVLLTPRMHSFRWSTIYELNEIIEVI